VQRIHLESFDLRGVTRFIEGALNCSGEKTDRLAGVLYRKSYGIPCFLGQLLKSIHAQHLINVQYAQGLLGMGPGVNTGSSRYRAMLRGLYHGKMQELPEK
jgi:predicted ATPase